MLDEPLDEAGSIILPILGLQVRLSTASFCFTSRLSEVYQEQTPALRFMDDERSGPGTRRVLEVCHCSPAQYKGAMRSHRNTTRVPDLHLP